MGLVVQCLFCSARLAGAGKGGCTAWEEVDLCSSCDFVSGAAFKSGVDWLDAVALVFEGRLIFEPMYKRSSVSSVIAVTAASTQSR